MANGNGLIGIGLAGLALFVDGLAKRLKQLEDLVNSLLRNFYVYNQQATGTIGSTPPSEPTAEFLNGNGFVYIEGLRLESVSDSRVTTVRILITAILDDNTEVAVIGWTNAVVGDTLRWLYDALPHGSVVKGVRVYAYSTDLTSGSTADITVRLTGVAT